MASSPAAPQREPLRQETIVDAAIGMVDSEGLGALAMRKLARSVDYEVMSLYNHVANKDELLFLMVDSVAGQIQLPAPDTAPLDAVRAIGISIHEVLVAHPWAADLWQQHLPGPARTRLMEELLRLLYESGLSPELAHHGFHAVNNHVLGYTLQELGMQMADDDPQAAAEDFMASLDDADFPYMIDHIRQHLDGDTSSSFELVLDLILDGLVNLDRAS